MRASSSSSLRPFWNPYLAGIFLGGVLLLAFVLTGHGLGASGFFTRLAAGLGLTLAPETTASNAYLGGYAALANPVAGWISWEVLGLLAGALMGSLTGGRFRMKVERGDGVSSSQRLIWALLGGILVGMGARFARGCTSGLGLSGSATLAVAGAVFLIGFFAAGFAMMILFRRKWQ